MPSVGSQEGLSAKINGRVEVWDILGATYFQIVLVRGKALTLLNEEGRVSMQSTWLWSTLPRTAATCSSVSRV